MNKNKCLDLPRLLEHVHRARGKLLAADAMPPKQAKSKKKQGTKEVSKEPPPGYLVVLVKSLIEVLDMREALAELKMNARGACLSSSKMREVLGSGFYGEVYKLPHDKVAKVQELADSSRVREWKREVAWGKLAGQLGVGPKVLDAFLCTEKGDVGGNPHGVIVMEHIKGMSLREFRKHAASGDEILKAESIVREKMQRLHDLGVHHNDLHAGNVLVVVGKRRSVADAFVLDYGLASNWADKKAEDFDDLQKLVDGRMARVSSYDIAIELVKTGVVRV